MNIEDSKNEKNFINELIKAIRDINISNLPNVNSLKNAVQSLACTMERIWEKNSKIVNITKYFKSWWDENCNKDLEKYRLTKHIKDWKQFKKTVKCTKYIFFDQNIQEIANKKHGPWELMSWVNKYKLTAVKAIKYNGHSCLEIEDLWHALCLSFNIAQDHQINICMLDKIPNKCPIGCVSFSEEEFISSITKCNNSSTLGPDKLSWRHLKCIVKDNLCLKKIINITDICFELGYWPSHFKISISIIIPKPNKKLYDSSKVFRPIVLLNTIEKLIKKVIGKKLQFQLILNNFIHLS